MNSLEATVRRAHPRIMAMVVEQPWAITRPALAQIIEILQRSVADAASVEAVAARLDALEAVSARTGRPLDNASWRAEVRGGTAVLNIDGPIFRYANLFTMVSGATSIEMLGLDLQAALDNSAIQQILLNVNTPGGQADGLNEMADAIRAADAKKPVYAYVGGMAASAGYWLASAARQIFANEGAFLGSIGTVIAIEDRTVAQERQGVKRYEIVSSQSPRKRVDPSTEAGREQLLEMANSMAQLFIDRVALFRKTTAENVLENFGRGGVLPAATAIRAGMADQLGSFEALLETLNSTKQEVYPMAATSQETGTNPNPPTQTQTPAPAAPAPTFTITSLSATAETAETERARIQGILALPEAQGREALAQQLALTPNLDAESAKRILAAAPTAAAAPPAAPANRLAAAMSQVPNPKIGAGSDDDGDANDEINKILAFAPDSHKYRRAS